MDSQGLIVAAVVVTAGTTFVNQAAANAVTFKPYLSAAFVGIFLSAMDMVSSQLAQNFCILVIVVALLRNGSKTLKLLGA
jgi:hypothetical protein